MSDGNEETRRHPEETSSALAKCKETTMKHAWLLYVGFGLVFALGHANAQINPFRSDRAGPTLSTTDLNRLNDSINRLNRTPKLEVGAEDQWSNPATGSHGSSAVTRIFTDGGRPCHAMRHEVYARGRTPPRSYNLTWCRADDGKWKIKS